MDKFLAEEYRVDGWYCVEFEAADMEAADKIATEMGWEFKGKIGMKIPAGPNFGETEAEELVDRLNRGGTFND